MCLSVAIDRPNDVIEKGAHAGLEYVITHNGSQFRCGYVKVLPGHPLHGKEQDEYSVEALDVHGGCTFAEADVPCDGTGNDAGWWFGFDCMHDDDAPDPTLPKIREVPYIFFPGYKGSIRTLEFVREQCFSLCEQLAKKLIK